MAFGLKIVAGGSIRSKNSFRRISRSGEREFDFKLQQRKQDRIMLRETEREGGMKGKKSWSRECDDGALHVKLTQDVD